MKKNAKIIKMISVDRQSSQTALLLWQMGLMQESWFKL